VVNQPVAARAWNRLICIVRLEIDLRPAIAHTGIFCRLGLAIFWRMILPRCSCLLAGLLPEARLTIYPDPAHGFLCSITAGSPPASTAFSRLPADSCAGRWGRW
jgi:hypothetical protein